MEQIIESTNNGTSQQNSVLQDETEDDENTDDDNKISNNTPIINTDNSEDLIVFENGISPILSRTCSEQNLSTTENEAEHLLDSELTQLEEVLQKHQSKNLIKFDNDHELNILINLNNSFSDNTDNTQIKKLHRSNSALLLDIFSDNNESSNHQVINRSKSANDLEFFNFDDELSSDNQRQQVLSITDSIEECLYDLDQYLQEYDLNDQEINYLSHSNPFRNTLSTVNCRKYEEFRRRAYARNTFNGFARKKKKLGNVQLCIFWIILSVN